MHSRTESQEQPNRKGKNMNDITGNKYHRLTAMNNTEPYNRNETHHYWRFLCDCGHEKVIRRDHVLSSKIRSCGCLAREGNNKKHGHTGTRLYNIWTHIISRTENRTNPGWKDYGGRGITICAEWRNNFSEFYRWAITNGYIDGLTIERINVNGGYSPNNCAWIPLASQNENKTNTVYLTYNGKKQSVKKWSEEIGTPIKTICNRLYSGWSTDEALYGRNRA